MGQAQAKTSKKRLAAEKGKALKRIRGGGLRGVGEKNSRRGHFLNGKLGGKGGYEKASTQSSQGGGSQWKKGDIHKRDKTAKEGGLEN